MKEGTVEAILDTNAVLALAKGRVLHLLPRIYEQLLYPTEIESEIQDALSRRAFEQAKAAWLRSAHPSAETLGTIPERLTRKAADRAVIALSLERPTAIVITGDRKIIAFLKTQNRQAFAPERVVLLLKEAGAIPLGRPVLEEMIRAHYDIPSRRLQALFEVLGEAHHLPS